MDAEKVQSAVGKSHLQEKVKRAIKASESLWNTNREVLFNLTLDEDVDAAMKEAVKMPKQMDKLLNALISYRKSLYDVAFASGS